MREIRFVFILQLYMRKSARGEGKMFENVYTRLRSFERTIVVQRDYNKSRVKF